MSENFEETLFVGGFPPNTNEEELRAYFSGYKSLSVISIVKNKGENSRGFGYITFTDEGDVKRVLRTRHKLKGKLVSLEYFDCNPTAQ